MGIKTFIKRISLLVLFFVSLSSYAQENNDNDKNKPHLLFERLQYNYGKIEYAGDGKYEFKFKNTGKTPLVLRNVQPSCGCTIAEWPKEPIKKGKKGKITIVYDTKRVGKFNKSITVFSNANNSPVRLTVKGAVLPKEEEK